MDKKRVRVGGRATSVAVRADPVQEDEQERRAGWIISIELVNFMCHENLKVDLKPDVNFITGRNGSGKSAIFSGLALVFGSKASKTGRGDNAASFIRSGCKMALIRVVLANTGLQRNPNYDGDTITVERTIRASGGASSYKIIDADGDTRSTIAADVHQLARGFGLQVCTFRCGCFRVFALIWLSLSDRQPVRAYVARFSPTVSAGIQCPGKVHAVDACDCR
jgi:hypothetical protein